MTFYELLQAAERDREILEGSLQENTTTNPTSRLSLSPLWRTEVSKLVRKLFFNGNSQQIRTVVLAGAGNDDSSTSVAAHTADQLATTVRGRVCVVDANVRQSSLHERFRASNELGFSNLVLDTAVTASAVAQNVGDNLWLLSSGSAPEPRQVFNPSLLVPRIAELRRFFDYLLIVAPDLDCLSDVIPIAQCCDGLVLIVRANSTRRDTVLRLKNEVEAANVKILGSVLTDRTFPIPQTIYSKL
jgi:protein-tyrosine kinase